MLTRDVVPAVAAMSRQQVQGGVGPGGESAASRGVAHGQRSASVVAGGPGRGRSGLPG